MGIEYDSKLFFGNLIDITLIDWGKIDWKNYLVKYDDPYRGMFWMDNLKDLQSINDLNPRQKSFVLRYFINQIANFKDLTIDFSYPYLDCDDEDVEYHLLFILPETMNHQQMFRFFDELVLKNFEMT